MSPSLANESVGDVRSCSTATCVPSCKRHAVPSPSRPLVVQTIDANRYPALANKTRPRHPLLFPITPSYSHTATSSPATAVAATMFHPRHPLSFLPLREHQSLCLYHPLATLMSRSDPIPIRPHPLHLTALQPPPPYPLANESKWVGTQQDAPRDRRVHGSSDRRMPSKPVNNLQVTRLRSKLIQERGPLDLSQHPSDPVVVSDAHW
ncbi:hypothetical protein BD779DRAFT_1483157 [Infundibulicybe gibba]|nr:hypothetical protein BD779DRAFT_1483157 [Infundibulicybe gibba]